MTATGEKPLKELLDQFTNAQKYDIHLYSGGHLNEANLKRNQDPSFYTSWESANKPPIPPYSMLPGYGQRPDCSDEAMKNTLVNFAIGTTGAQPQGRLMRKPPKGTKGPVNYPDSSRPSTNESQYSRLDDGVLVEDLRIPEGKYVRPPRKTKLKGWAEEDFKKDKKKDRIESPSQSDIKDQNLDWVRHNVMPSHLEGVTKTDQYKRMKNYESNIMRKQDAMEQKVLTGVKSVEHLEAKLQEDLDELQYNGYGPNFHRLQIYSNILDDLIWQTPTFGYILKNIKKEYDDYIATLLDSQTAKHQVLYDQVEQLSTRDQYNPKKLSDETSRVGGMEKEARVLLELNERLRKELEEELEKAQAPVKAPPRLRTFKEDSSLDLVDKVEEIHSTILAKLDHMNDLRNKLRTEYVPSTVCTHLEQCIKETEVEIQKLATQKEFYERSINDMEKDLQEAIEAADTTERDARRIWRKITAVNIGSKQVLFDSDEEEATKWNWYIS